MIPNSGIIGSQFWQSVLVMINHVFSCLQNIAVLHAAITDQRLRHGEFHKTLVTLITSFLRVTLRDVVTMFTFAIVSCNAWA
jgi:hypothetical protein